MNDITADKSRPFDEVWQEIEARHGWKIEISQYDNPEPAVSRYPFIWSDYDNRRAAEFREKYRLDQILEGAEDDWDAALRIRHWVFTHMINDTHSSFPGGVEPFSKLDPFALLEASRVGGTFWCSYFSMVMVAAGTACGLPVRKQSIDCEHMPDEKGTHHGVVDVWVDRFRKWVHMDPNYDHHFEYEGVPMSTEEVGKRWQTARGEGIQPVTGIERRPMDRARKGKPEDHESRTLFWHLIECRNDVFRLDGRGSKALSVLLVDEARKKQRWTQGTPPNSFEKIGYSDGTMMITEDYADAYPDVNAAFFKINPPHKIPYYCRVRLDTPMAPFFSHYEIRVDGGEPERLDGLEYPWRLHTGTCRFEARTVNVAGRRGPAYSMELNVEHDKTAKPTWP